MMAQVLWLYGADAVGKSAVGWEVYTRLAGETEDGGAGEPVAYLDTDYLGFCSPAPADQAGLVAANLTAVWAGFAAAGARRLVVSGIMVTAEDRDRFARTVPGAWVTFCRLTARPETVRDRIVLRREVEEATRGSELSAEVRTELEAYGERSVGFAELLERLALEDFAVATDDGTPAEIARTVIARWRDLSSRR